MTDTPITIELPKWYDLHAHFRQDEMIAPLIKGHIAMGCAGILAMPNTKPPVGKIFKSDPGNYTSIEHYSSVLRSDGGDTLKEIIVPLYLTTEMTPALITRGAEMGMLKCAKYYPPHGTTGAELGAPLETYVENGVFAAMEGAGVVLNIHGEEHALPAEQYFDRTTNAEELFYRERLPRIVDQFPNLKIVGEHLTTKIATDFISAAPDHIVATVTPQHLLYTIGHLLQGFKYHLYCLPLIKFEEDREALRAAVTHPGNDKFFAGTDSAPHTTKATECGCAAGCYTGAIAPQLYAQSFELAGVDLSDENEQEIFKNFLCFNGPDFYGLDIPTETFTLQKFPQEIEPLKIGKNTIVPLPLGMQSDTNEPCTIPWRIV